MRNLVLSIKNNHLTFYLLAGGIFFSLVMYMYFINGTVRNAVAREDTESQVLALKNKISDLEYLYMVGTNSITLDLAKTYGLSEPKEKVFISKTQNKSLSFK